MAKIKQKNLEALKTFNIQLETLKAVGHIGAIQFLNSDIANGLTEALAIVEDYRAVKRGGNVAFQMLIDAIEVDDVPEKVKVAVRPYAEKLKTLFED